MAVVEGHGLRVGSFNQHRNLRTRSTIPVTAEDRGIDLTLVVIDLQEPLNLIEMEMFNRRGVCLLRIVNDDEYAKTRAKMDRVSTFRIQPPVA